MKKQKITLFSFLLISLGIFAQVPSSGLVAYYKFNGNANDSSGYGNHGSVNGASLTTDRFGNTNSAYHFNGTSDYILVSANSSIQPANALSVSVWFKSESNTIQWQPIVCKHISSSFPYDSYYLGTGTPSPVNNRWYGVISNTNNVSQNAISKSTAFNVWTLLTFTYDGSSIRTYINGVLDTTNSFTGSIGYSSAGLYIGHNGIGGQFFKGSIDDVMIYNRALTNNEITNIYNFNPASSNLTDLVAWYKFEGNALDSSGYGNHGTAYGAKLAMDRYGNLNGAYRFNGAGDYILVPASNSIQPANALTVSVWYNSDSNNTQWQPLVCKHISNSFPYDSYLLGTGTPSPVNKRWYGVISNTNNFSQNAISRNSDFGKWTLLTFTYDGTTIKTYVNGNLDTTNSFSGNIGYSSSGLYIGHNGIAGQYFRGLIDDIKIYNRALSASEVSAMYSPIASNILNGSHVACSGIPAIPIMGSLPAGGFASSSYNYTWIASTTSANSGYGIAPGISNTQNYLPGIINNSTWYKRIVQSGSSIDTSAAFLISVYSKPIVSAAANPNKLCQGEFVTFSGSGALNYDWTGGIINGVPFKANTSGTFTVIGTDANGCSDTASQTITVNPLPNVIAHATTNPVCAGTPTTLFGSGALSYSWSNNVQNNVAFFPSATTNYTLTGTDSLGCSNTATQLITVNTMPDKSISINGSTITAIEIGATYQWLNCATGKTPILGATGRSLTDSTNGSYAVIVTKNNCSDTSSCVMVNASSIEDLFAKNTFIKVYPNPNTGSFSIISNSEENIFVTNELGQVVLTFNLNRSNSFTQQINNLNNGIYFVIGNQTHSKIIVTK